MPPELFVVPWDKAPEHELAPGLLARIVHGEQLTLSLVDIEPNAALPVHHHAQEQGGWMLEGELHFTVDGQAHTIRAGEAYLLRGGVPHGATAGPEGARVLDFFAPLREDMPGMDWP